MNFRAAGLHKIEINCNQKRVRAFKSRVTVCFQPTAGWARSFLPRALAFLWRPRYPATGPQDPRGWSWSSTGSPYKRKMGGLLDVECMCSLLTIDLYDIGFVLINVFLLLKISKALCYCVNNIAHWLIKVHVLSNNLFIHSIINLYIFMPATYHTFVHPFTWQFVLNQ